MPRAGAALPAAQDRALMTFTAHAFFAVLHVLAGAAWFGSMFYSLTVLQPRAKVYFATDIEFEDFVATLAAGARWKVLGAFAIVLLSGMALVPFASPQSHAWWCLIAIKTLCYLIALVVFCHTSWNLWPRRIFAPPDQIAILQRAFRRVGITLLSLIALDMTIGVVAHLL